MCKLCVGAYEAAAIDQVPVRDSFAVSIKGSGSVAVRDLVERSAEEINKRVLDLDSMPPELS